MEIECTFENFQWADSKLIYSCEVTSCNITGQGSAVATFKGDHKTRKTNNSVEGLLFNRTKVHYIPRNLTKIFPNLAHLSIYECELKKVSVEDLVGHEKLESLHLEGNKITFLPEDLFKNMPKLKDKIRRKCSSANQKQNRDHGTYG